ncbi:hypothetical protein M9458_052970 [Cirrhinus mrigala]|uniref:Integrase catalytic domain-containing protein n=1 Tax=Cirrhinus mrigala TaxID=683832 RepID=A0ABD0MP78_CIRMR
MDERSNNEEMYQSLVTRSIAQSSRKSSTTSSAVLRARARAEAARMQVSFAQKEAEMMVEEATLKAKMHILKMEKEAATATAEEAVFAAAVENADLDSHHDIDLSLLPSNAAQRTSEYVLRHSSRASESIPMHTSSQPAVETVKQEMSNLRIDNEDTHLLIAPKNVKSQPSVSTIQHTPGNVPPVQTQIKRHFKPHVDATYLRQPTQRRWDADNSVKHTATTPDVAKYLMRREMVTSGLMEFDDQPENYWAWKTSFRSVIDELTLSPREELDLLIKWLGPASKEQARRIRAIHSHNSAAGLSMVWQRLKETYGTPEAVEHSLLKRIEEFPRISNRDNVRLRELGDILLELEYAKEGGYLPGLAYLDTSRGVNPILEKLPFSLQEKWISQGSKYKECNHVPYPPFTFFSQFIRSEAKTRNDPSFMISQAHYSGPTKTERPTRYNNKVPVSVRKTDVFSEAKAAPTGSVEKRAMDPDRLCPLHNKPHALRKCRTFRSKPIEERKTYLREKNICFRCCGSTNHRAKDCDKEIVCRECGSKTHTSALHPGPAPWFSEVSADQGEEEETHETPSGTLPAVTSKCTEVCGGNTNAKSCCRICLVKFFDHFGLYEKASPYTLKTCAGVMETSGRRATNFVVESFDGKIKIKLPTLIECEMIPDDRAEIPTPEIARYFLHLRHVADKIPPLNENAQILILLGRDILRVHKVRQQYNGDHEDPYAQRLDLGWVIVGDVCLDRAHKPPSVSVYKTHTLPNGRTSMLSTCPNKIQVKETLNRKNTHQPRSLDCASQGEETEKLGATVFDSHPDDEKVALSVDDETFLDIMDKEVFVDQANSWVAPLPFCKHRRRLPNNREMALRRLASLRRTLDRCTDMREHFLEFMGKVFENDHAETAPELEEHQERWYLPLFGVYHPQKPNQIRVVFDSSAKHDGVSLNDVLLSGPDLNNALLGILIRFRKENIAVTADIQQMFYAFVVREDHRDYLRFLWYKDNDLNNNITEYRMKVHIFGNSPSPSVAIYGLRRAAQEYQDEYGTDSKEFVMRNFYVDDGLTSVPTEEEAIDLLQRTQKMLAASNLKLHKIASNSSKVMTAFAPEDLAKDLKDLDFSADPLPLQRSLGLIWNLESDSFGFQVSQEEKPFTKRGILSTVQSIYDPLGFVAPITIQGKVLIRELSSKEYDWDDPLPPDKQESWKLWRESLLELEKLHFKRRYVPMPLVSSQSRELCLFSDASTQAIAAVAYLRVTNDEDQCHVGFVMGKAKLAPHPAHTVPRLELCAAVLAAEMVDTICCEMDIEMHAVRFFTDSRIVLGYIHNTSRRFHVYVANRVNRIRKSSHSQQWQYVATEQNPADHATRPILRASNWFSGPEFLKSSSEPPQSDSFGLVNPELDVEVRAQVAVNYTKATEGQFSSARFERSSSWKRLLQAITKLIQVTRTYSKTQKMDAVDARWQAKTVVIRCVQQEFYGEELKCLGDGIQLSKKSSLRKLNPFIDEDGLLRIGGRLTNAYPETRDIPRSVDSGREPPFTHVGLDVFGPWSIVTRRTRGGSAESKRWAVLFTCMSTRATHIEVLESMSTSSFINALRRFFAIRGSSKQLRSDRGTNFIGACKELKFNISDPELTSFLDKQGCSWTFNSPHSSHMGGCWERLIGVARRILEGMLLRSDTKHLTHEVLTTLMAEVMAILNARPLISVSTDPDNPSILTPAMILTQKITPVTAPPGDFDHKDLHKSQWKQVQCLAESFWKRWRQEYLVTLQKRHKWTDDKPNIQVDDVVLMKDSQAKRNDWPIGLVVKTLPSKDNKVRKVEVKVSDPFSDGPSVRASNSAEFTHESASLQSLVKSLSFHRICSRLKSFVSDSLIYLICNEPRCFASD